MSNKLTPKEHEEKKSLFGLYKIVLPTHYQVYVTVKTLLEQEQWKKPY
jgi:hypothetical protein